MMRRLLAVLLIGAFGFLSGSLQGQDKAKMPETAWYPLQVGNKWTYTATAEKEGANKLKAEYRVTAIEEFGGTTCAKVELFIDGKPQSFEHLSVTADGVYRQGFQGNKADKPVLLLKLPPKDGETWTIDSKSTGGETLKGTFKTKEKEEKVGDKSYKTIEVTSEGMDAGGLKFSTTYYFAQDVGMVKQVVIVGEATKQQTILELEKFEGVKKEEPKVEPKDEKKDEKKEK